MTNSISSSPSPWQIGGRTLTSRFFLGTALYPSPRILQEAIAVSGAQVVTVGLRRQLAHGSEAGDFFALVRESGAHLLPNTAGCHTAREAVTPTCAPFFRKSAWTLSLNWSSSMAKMTMCICWSTTRPRWRYRTW